MALATDIETGEIAARRRTLFDAPFFGRGLSAPVVSTGVRADNARTTDGVARLVPLVLALPFAALLLVAVRGGVLLDSPNSWFASRVSELNFSAGSATAMGWLRELYPPFAVLLAVLIPGGSVGLGIAGALVAGLFLSYIYRVLVAHGWERRTVLILLAAGALTPVFLDLVIGNLFGLLGIITFGLGVLNMFLFVTDRHTDAGFRAGTWFLICSLIDPAGILLVAIAFIAAPFLGVARRHQSGARTANLAVIFYPVLSVFVTTVLIQAAFFRDPFALYGSAFTSPNWGVLTSLFDSPRGWALVLIAQAGIFVSWAVGRRWTAFLPLLILAVILLAEVVGIMPSNEVGYTLLAVVLVIFALWHRLPDQRRLMPAALVFAFLVAALSWASVTASIPYSPIAMLLHRGVA